MKGLAAGEDATVLMPALLRRYECAGGKDVVGVL
jgi:hypothetical protein